jgi:hypothetical protein
MRENLIRKTVTYIDGGEVVSLTCRPPSTSQDDYWYSFLSEAESTPQGHSGGWKD